VSWKEAYSADCGTAFYVEAAGIEPACSAVPRAELQLSEADRPQVLAVCASAPRAVVTNPTKNEPKLVVPIRPVVNGLFVGIGGEIRARRGQNPRALSGLRGPALQ
jgi:hypothetical protein